MITNEININKNICFSGSIHGEGLYCAKPKPGEIVPPGKDPEIIPPQPSPVTWPEKEPEIQPEREPLTQPPASPPEVPKPPESKGGIFTF
jgi:hypothetical protein